MRFRLRVRKNRRTNTHQSIEFYNNFTRLNWNSVDKRSTRAKLLGGRIIITTYVLFTGVSTTHCRSTRFVYEKNAEPLLYAAASRPSSCVMRTNCHGPFTEINSKVLRGCTLEITSNVSGTLLLNLHGSTLNGGNRIAENRNFYTVSLARIQKKRIIFHN